MLVQPRVWISHRQRRAGGLPRLRLSAAHDEWNHVGIALAAIELGFLAEEGLDDVELITFPEDAGALLDREQFQADLLASGTVDVGIDPRTTFIVEGRAQGKPLAIVAARRKNHAFLVVGQKGLQSLDDLRGMTLHMSQRGGATDVMLRRVLKDSAIDPDEDVTIRYVGGEMHNASHVIAAFRAGDYGPAILTSFKDSLDHLIKDGYPVLADLRSRYPSRHDRVTAANSNFVARHPESVKGLLKGMIRACNWVLDPGNGPRFKQIIVDAGYMTSDREQANFDGLFYGWQERVSRDLTLPRDGIELIVNEIKQDGRIAPSFDVDDVLALAPLAAAQAEVLGATSPASERSVS
ncbi:MAG TPA: ABC transporter substrate-binding protein [Chloroflexota bacterium]|nr:ABC transporter substrate-binding protein [Chloroflexota bacterium]